MEVTPSMIIETDNHGTQFIIDLSVLFIPFVSEARLTKTNKLYIPWNQALE